MNNKKRYFGLIGFIIVLILCIAISYTTIAPMMSEFETLKNKKDKKEKDLDSTDKEVENVRKRIEEVKDANVDVQKKLYLPVESDLGNDTLFFTLYSDFIEMIHANSIKIKAIDYKYNPEDDPFVASGKDYFVFDVDVELVSNYTNLGKLIQDIYQYPYFLKINSLIVKPYNKDKKILISNLSVRLYAHAEPEQ